MPQDRPPRVFSGIQPSGNLHLGNYLGAIKQWVAMQDHVHALFCIVDLHAITVPQDPAALHRKTREVALIYIAAGLDPARNIIFVQSHRPEHSQLCWLLNCVTPVGWLERMTQYKLKSAAQDSVSTGLLDYPALQAADILLYDTDLVPVGDDQRQHVELTRDIAIRFNNLYGETFVVPGHQIPKVGARIMGLDDPAAKMSKSLAVTHPGHAIGLLDSPDTITKAIKRAVTDSGREVRFDEDRPGLYNLLVIYELLSGTSRADIEDHFSGKGYGALKTELAELTVEYLRPLQTRYHDMASDPRLVEDWLRDGAERARVIAARTLQRAQERLGLG